jgi:hypothetical protein
VASGAPQSPEGCVTWRRVEGFAPEHGARGYETYVDVALLPGDNGREDLVVEIRAAGLANEDVVAARRSPNGDETSAGAASRAARVVARGPGLVGIALPDRPWTGARIALFTTTPLGDVAVEARRGDRSALVAPMPSARDVGPTLALLCAISLGIHASSSPSPHDTFSSTVVFPLMWAVILGMHSVEFAYMQTLKHRSIQPLLAVAFGRQPAAGPPTSPAPPAQPTADEVDLRRPAGNAAAT